AVASAATSAAVANEQASAANGPCQVVSRCGGAVGIAKSESGPGQQGQHLSGVPAGAFRQGLAVGALSLSDGLVVFLQHGGLCLPIPIGVDQPQAHLPARVEVEPDRAVAERSKVLV